MIVEHYQLTATNTDVLAAGTSRLASLPYNGMLHLEFQADLNEAANHWNVTIQTPDGDTPLDSCLIPEGANAGSINANDKFQVSLPSVQGGHVTVNCAETGTAVLEVRATLMP